MSGSGFNKGSDKDTKLASSQQASVEDSTFEYTPPATAFGSSSKNTFFKAPSMADDLYGVLGLRGAKLAAFKTPVVYYLKFDSEDKMVAAVRNIESAFKPEKLCRVASLPNTIEVKGELIRIIVNEIAAHQCAGIALGEKQNYNGKPGTYLKFADQASMNAALENIQQCFSDGQYRIAKQPNTIEISGFLLKVIEDGKPQPKPSYAYGPDGKLVDTVPKPVKKP